MDECVRQSSYLYSRVPKGDEAIGFELSDVPSLLDCAIGHLLFQSYCAIVPDLEHSVGANERIGSIFPRVWVCN